MSLKVTPLGKSYTEQTAHSLGLFFQIHSLEELKYLNYKYRKEC